MKRIFSVFFSSHKRLAAFLVFSALVLSIPVTISFLGQNQDIRQRAEGGCTYRLVGTSFLCVADVGVSSSTPPKVPDNTSVTDGNTTYVGNNGMPDPNTINIYAPMSTPPPNAIITPGFIITNPGITPFIPPTTTIAPSPTAKPPSASTSPTGSPTKTPTPKPTTTGNNPCTGDGACGGPGAVCVSGQCTYLYGSQCAGASTATKDPDGNMRCPAGQICQNGQVTVLPDGKKILTPGFLCATPVIPQTLPPVGSNSTGTTGTTIAAPLPYFPTTTQQPPLATVTQKPLAVATQGPTATTTTTVSPTTTPIGDARCSLTPGAQGCPCGGQNDSQCTQPLVCTNSTCQTPPATGTPTTTPTPTIPAGNTGLAITVALPGVGTDTAKGQNNAPKTPTRVASVKVFNEQNQEVKSVTGNVTYSNGKYSGNIDLGSGLASGNYLVKVRFNNTLWKRIPGIVVITSASINQTTAADLVSGDFNQDNSLEISDFNKMISCSRSLSDCSAADKSLADLNDDFVTNDSLDVAILLSNFAHRTGD